MSGHAQTNIKHFVFVSRDREKIHEPAFYNNKGIAGAQIKYPWKQLEPEKDKYDFSAIEEDIAFLELHHKKLFIQLQDVTFDSTVYAIPKYLLNDTLYHGGAASQYGFTREHRPVKEGWVARRWDPAVAKRFHHLLAELGRRFDGRIEGINLPETAVDFPHEPGLIPTGFSGAAYLEAVKATMLVMKNCFKKSVPLQYANFMPGDSKTELEEVYRYAKEIKLAMGGPDIKVYRPFQMKNSYPLIRELYGIVPTGVAVQDGNYNVINPQTGKPVTLPEIQAFAHDYLKLTYIFWCTEEPWYSKEVLPMLASQE